MSTVIEKKTTCPLDCPDCCGLIAEVIDGRVVKLRGDRDHPYTNGFICSKMKRYPERVYGSLRVLYPQKRVGKKGEGLFERISWDEALDICAESLHGIKRKFGGEAILPYSYAGNMGQISRFCGNPLFHKIGASVLKQTICSTAAVAGWKENCGNLPGCPPENAAHADLIVAWGINIKVSNVHFWQYVAQAKKKGAKLLVIDPYLNQTGKSADYYIQVKPGGDAALALGIIKFFIKQGDLNDSFIAAYTDGFDEFQRYVQSCSWELIVAESGIGKAEIEAIAQLLGKVSKTFLRIGIGLSRNSRGGNAIRAITSFAAVLGLFEGGKGRGVLLTAGAFNGNSAKLTWPQLAEKPVRSINMIQLGKALSQSENPVKALVVYNSNPATVNPDADIVRKGLAREDIFTIVHEQVMTPTAKFADILLPATTFLENQDVYLPYGHFYLHVIKPVIEPLGEAKSNFDFFQKLAAKMGYTDTPFQQSIEERIVDFLSDMEGIGAEHMVDEVVNGKLVCSTNSSKDGRLLFPAGKKYSFLGKHSYGQAPSYFDENGEFDDPDLQSRFPLKLITPPHPNLLNSTFGDLYVNESGEFLIHPDDATTYGVRDGEAAFLFNHRGKVKRTVKVTDDTQPGLIVAEGLFWQESSGGINNLTSQKLTDIGGGATFHESLVAVKPA